MKTQTARRIGYVTTTNTKPLKRTRESPCCSNLERLDRSPFSRARPPQNRVLFATSEVTQKVVNDLPGLLWLLEPRHVPAFVDEREGRIPD
jgi:hypothetical protein